MSYWDERFEQHALHASLQTLQELFEKALARARENAEELELFDRIRVIVEATVRALQAADPVLVSVVTLNSINSSAQAAIKEVTNYIGNGNSAHLTNANSNIDAVVPLLVCLGGLRVPADADGIRDAVSSFRKSVGQHNRYLDEEHSRLKATSNSLTRQVEALANAIESHKARLDGLVEQFQERYSAAETARGVQATNSEAQRSESFSAAISEMRTQIGKTTSEFRTNIDRALSDLSDKISERTAAADAAFQLATDELQAKARTMIEALQAHKTHAETLLSAITMTGNAAGFQRVADDERKAARRFQLLAVSSMAVLVIFAIIAFQELVGTQFSWGVLGARMFVFVAVGILAAYGARQSDKHYSAERRYRKLELELASLHPFLADLPTEMQHEIKRDLTTRLFGSEVIEEAQKSETTGTALDAVKLLVDAFKELAKGK
jgi:Sec-independent protein translocase protein TatA